MMEAVTFPPYVQSLGGETAQLKSQERPRDSLSMDEASGIMGGGQWGMSGGWGQRMEGKDIVGRVVMETEGKSSPPLEYSSMLKMPLLCEDVAYVSSKFPFEFSIFVILMFGLVML